jgi:hypothetical protein
MTQSDLLAQIRGLLEQCSQEQLREIYHFLHGKLRFYDAANELNASADLVFEALSLMNSFQIRNFRGMLAEAAFKLFVLDTSPDLKSLPVSENAPYDFLIDDGRGPIRIQVKLQRRHGQRAMIGSDAPNYMGYDPEMFIVETWKTRSGDRYYPFGDFDIVAVCMHPSTGDWSSFMIVPAACLIPNEKDPTKLMHLQPVPPSPDDCWVTDLKSSISKFRSGTQLVINRKLRP